MMLQLPVYNQSGEQTGQVELDEAVFGGQVRPALLKQAIVAHLANCRQGTVATRNRSRVEGSTRKIYRQKGTGRARMGTVRTVIRKGGGVAFEKLPRDFTQKLPAKARRRALDSALLAKFQAGDALVLEALELAEIKTRPMAELLDRLKIDGSCLLVLAEPDGTVWRSTRNLPGVSVSPVRELYAYGVAAVKKMVLTRGALDTLVAARSSEVRAAEGVVETT
jgi:large subunit ribosomal protein L4